MEKVLPSPDNLGVNKIDKENYRKQRGIKNQFKSIQIDINSKRREWNGRHLGAQVGKVPMEDKEALLSSWETG